jgi:hypothetical protein
MAETYEQWEAALLEWLMSLPPDHPVRSMDEIDQCVAFSKWREAQTHEG